MQLFSLTRTINWAISCNISCSLWFRPFASFSAIIESTPPTSKRIKTRVVRSGGRLEGWFPGDNELVERYCFETSTKVINNPKVVSFDWLKSQKLDNVRKFLKDQLLRRFLEMKGNIYPDLIRVFYTNLTLVQKEEKDTLYLVRLLRYPLSKKMRWHFWNYFDLRMRLFE